MNIPRNLSFTNRQATGVAVVVSLALTVTVSPWAGLAFIFCAYAVITA